MHSSMLEQRNCNKTGECNGIWMSPFCGHFLVKSFHFRFCETHRNPQKSRNIHRNPPKSTVCVRVPTVPLWIHTFILYVVKHAFGNWFRWCRTMMASFSSEQIVLLPDTLLLCLICSGERMDAKECRSGVILLLCNPLIKFIFKRLSGRDFIWIRTNCSGNLDKISRRTLSR